MDTLDILNIQVKEVMTKDPICVHLNDSMQSVDDILSTHPFNHVPVIDDDGMVKGIISRQDVALLKHWGSSLNIKSSQIKNQQLFTTQCAAERMTSTIVYVSPEVTLEYCADIFKENLFHALPVVQNNRIVGIITPLDLIAIAYNKENLISK
jgi:CBS domain-containing protein